MIQETPKYYPYNLSAVGKLRGRIISDILVPRYNTTPTDIEFELLAQDLGKQLRQVSYQCVFETTRQLVGQELTPELCDSFAWLIAGNVPALKEGTVVLPWTPGGPDEWVPVQFLRCDRSRNPYRPELGYQYRLRVLAGRPAGMFVEKFMSDRYVSAAARKIGFTAAWRQMPYGHGSQFVGLRVYAKVDTARSRDRPEITDLYCPGGCADWNRYVLKMRFKLEPPCPRGWHHPCHVCAIGYDSCPAATHFKTYVKKFCTHCGNMDAFDPESNSPYCVSCTVRENLRTKNT